MDFTQEAVVFKMRQSLRIEFLLFRFFKVFDELHFAINDRHCRVPRNGVGKSAVCERVFWPVGAEFRGPFHEGSFRVLGSEFKRVFLARVRWAGTSSERAATN